MYVHVNIEAPSPNNCCRGKRISITHSECMCILAQFSARKAHATCLLSSVAYLAVLYFPTHLINVTILRRESVIKSKICVLVFSTAWSEIFLILQTERDFIKGSIGFQESTRYSRQSYKLEFSPQVFAKSSNIKFHENLSSESEIVPRGRNRQTEIKFCERA